MEDQLTCARCGKALSKDQAHMGQPFITAGELVRTSLKSPAVLFGPELPEVAYCEECRQIIAKKRPIEQIKVLLGLLVIIGLVLLLVFVLLP